MDRATYKVTGCRATWVRYRRVLGLLGIAALCLVGCSSAPLPYDAAAPAADGQVVSAQRREVVRVASQQIGTPYRYGGNSREGFDCSGLVQYSHREAGIQVPRTTGLQWRHARTPRREHLVPGDLLFFRMGAAKGRHVGIYTGEGVFIHAPSSGKRVGRASIDNPFWQRRLIGAKTFL
jgi:cell wall-associated NlpC family hydrolase